MWVRKAENDVFANQG